MMEENVALDSNKQKQFVKSIKGIKKLIKKKDNVPPLAPAKPDSKAAKDRKRRIKERGLVYLSHIPHGFYENEMTQYFKQFGRVTNVRVIRSKRTGNSRGCAFVEFSEPAVAQIVTDTMNNYLMGKRLIKAALIPPEKQRRHALRKNWNQINNPGNMSKLKLKKKFNAKKTPEEDLVRARQIVKNLNKTKKRLKEMDIDYDFFTPVDIPEELQKKPEVKPENDSKKSKLSAKPTEVVGKKVKTKKEDSNIKINIAGEKTIKAPKETSKLAKKDKKKPVDVKNVERTGKKQQKIKDAGMKLPENFIKISHKEPDGDSDDGSINFDSDEFENEQEFNEEFNSDAEQSVSEDGSNDEEESNDDEISNDEEGSNDEEISNDEVSNDEEGSNDEEDDHESSEEEPPIPKKGQLKLKQQQIAKVGKNKPAVLQPPKKQVQKGKQPYRPPTAPKGRQTNKRKGPPSPEVNMKKQKFEKKGKHQAKLFKKKK